MHRAQLDIESNELDQKKLAEILNDFVDSIVKRADAEGGKVNIFIIDDMEDIDPDDESEIGKLYGN
jgi:predicted Zn-dependent protease